jgi:hypothetical protein
VASPSDLSMKNTRGSGGFRRLKLAADRFLDVERVLAMVIGEISDRLARLVQVRDHSGRHRRHLQNGSTKLHARIHRDHSGLRAFISRSPSTAGKRIQPANESVFVPLHALKVQSDQIAHRELAVSRCIDHLLEARGFNEQVLAVGEHLVRNQGMWTLEVLAEVIDGSTNLRQLDLVLASKRVQDMRFGEVAERQPEIRRICEFDDRFGSAACAGAQRIRPARDPGTQSILGNLEVPRRLEH